MNRVIELCGYSFHPASDEWDRLYGVDFYLQIGSCYIGIQVKPRTFRSSGFLGRYKGTLRDQHRRFRKEFRGSVFVVVKEQGFNPNDPALCKALTEEIDKLKSLHNPSSH